MLLQKKCFRFFGLIAFLFTSSFCFGQMADSLVAKKGKLPTDIEKVKVDGQLAYRNKATNQFCSQLECMILTALEMKEALEEKGLREATFSYTNWENDRVNPYYGQQLPTPFKITFDQSTFTHPIEDKVVVTSRFGRRRRGPHKGIDLDLVTGDSVRSVLPGKVRFVGYSRGHGKTVVVRHANEVETLYAHLSAQNVKANDIVSEGQVIGLGGNTGNSRGSHLHLEVRYKGVCIHPEYVFNFDGSQTLRGEELWVSNAWKSPRFHSAYRKSEVNTLLTQKEAIAAENAEPRYYRVRSGDTLSHIAQRYNLGIREICSLNAISINSILRIGQVLKVR